MAVAKQGHGDGLCGIYSLLNAMASFEEIKEIERPKRHVVIFGQLVMGADQLGYLDHHHVTVGFEAFELLKIFNWVVDNFSYPLVAENLTHLAHRELGALDQAIQQARNDKHVAVFYVPEDHWVACTSDALMDSWPLSDLVADTAPWNASQGFVIRQQQPV